MSSVFVAATIIILLIVLVCYAFISQNLEKKRKQKQRLLSALKTRSRNFKYILTGFPPNFLPRSITVLVHRCLIDVCEQLAKLEPESSVYLEELELYTNQMEELQRAPKQAAKTKLDNPQQIKEVRQLLQELQKFILQLERRGTVSAAQAGQYGHQLKTLILQVSVDSYLTGAKQADQAGKTRLVLHFYSLAHKLLLKDKSDKSHLKQVEQLAALIKKTEAKLAEEEPLRAITAKNSDPTSQEWAEFDDEDKWQKKNVYD